jgi:predicted aminopeptidase
MVKILILLFLLQPLAGCYYVQAASGQWEVMRKKQPVDKIIDDPGTAPELKTRLRLLDAARDFSVAELGLPDNKSYRSYTQLQRDYVVWNVFAAEEFSFDPKQWCFPVAGCVSYRGYFSKEDALRKSEQLAVDGYDVAVGGVAAYSTLGNFNDPILSTMMRWEDEQLVAVMFHELAHQVVYVKDDSAFNESFATAVEEFGMQRWLNSRGEGHKVDEYLARRQLQQDVSLLVADAKKELQQVYDSDIDVARKREEKRARLKELSTRVALTIEEGGQEASGWLSGELNNARLISTTLYEGFLPAFRKIYANCEWDLPCFYAEAERLAEMDDAKRVAALSAGEALRTSFDQ